MKNDFKMLALAGMLLLVSWVIGSAVIELGRAIASSLR
jgi:hypothetical protein